ncbi:MAG: LemA-like protein [Microgenomates group bacterium GW2011_GWC1_39_12]|nr:MAG: LemA-like protein [Microgenomates group bacterium GW2011_GWC1_39_12]
MADATKEGKNMIFYVLGAVVLIILFIWSLYNSLITMSTQIDEAWSQIDVQLKRRVDLIPNIVASVKGYAKHEKSVFENVTKARSAMMKAETPQAMAKASDGLSSALKSLFAVAENYPQLKANENFVQLQNQLSDTEDKIAYSRQFYNSTVTDFNVKVRVFPNTILAGMLGFKEKPFFKTEGADREAVKVQF